MISGSFGKGKRCNQTFDMILFFPCDFLLLERLFHHNNIENQILDRHASLNPGNFVLHKISSVMSGAASGGASGAALSGGESGTSKRIQKVVYIPRTR